MKITKSKKVMTKRLMAIALAISLLTTSVTIGTGVKKAEAQTVTFIDIDPTVFDPSLTDPLEQPWGIVGPIPTGPDDFNVYVTLERQGLIAKVTLDRQVVDIFNDPDDQKVRVENGALQHFYGITKDPFTGNLYTIEREGGKLWRFNPATAGPGSDGIRGTADDTGWTRIPLIEKVEDPNGPGMLPNVAYPLGHDGVPGYNVAPWRIKFNTTGGNFDTEVNVFNSDNVIFTKKGFIWTGLGYDGFAAGNAEAAFDGLTVPSFIGLARVNISLIDVNTTLAVTRIPITGASVITGLAVDSVDPSIIWITDFGNPGSPGQVFRFNTSNNMTDLAFTFPMDPFTFDASGARGIVTDDNFVYIANNVGGIGSPQNSTIFRISKLPPFTSDLIDTGQPNTVEGTFSVIVNNGLLVWTDGNFHVGIIDLAKGFTPGMYAGSPSLIPVNQTVFGTVTEGNHYGIIAKDGEFWFAGHGSSKVGIIENSKFSGGRPVSPTSHSGSGGYDSNAIVDTIPPTIINSYSDPEIPRAGQDVTINANIGDDVGVEKAVLQYYSAEDDYRKAHLLVMTENPGADWFAIHLNGLYTKEPGFKYQVVAVDAAGNSATSDMKEVKVQQGASLPEAMTKQTSIPAYVLAAIKPKPVTPTQKLEVISMRNGNEINAFSDKIIIRNTGNVTADNIRVMLSPEIAHSFKLGTYTVGSIAPHSNVTISLQPIGNQNKDVFGGLTGYNGNVIVMGEHLSPILLPVIIDTGEYLQGHKFIMPKLSGMEQQKREVSILSNGKVFSNGISLLNSILSKHQAKNSNYEVTTSSSKDDVITKPSGDIVIRNLSDKELKNIRIVVSGAGNIFLLDNKVIHHLAPHAQISIRMIPTINTKNYSPKDINGELLIVPSNDNPIFIPIDIPAVERKDSANEFEANTMQGKDSIVTAADKIVIKNDGNRTMDSVTLRLSNNLARVATLSKNSFTNIEPNGKVTVEFKYNADLKTNANLKTFMQDYKGELIIASEHHNIRSIPVNIEWKKIESNHFVIYSRSGDEQTAKQIKDFLESNYVKITSRFGKMDSKTVIYMTNNMDEMKLVNPAAHPYYSYADDKIFVCKCDEPKFDALKEFVYRLIINNYPSYHNTKKILFDKENWLLDGISDYIASKIYGHGIEKKEIDAFTTDPTGFEWYGYGSDAGYGATYTFLDYLTGKYEDKVIDKTLYYLGSGMTNNHRCDTLENCALLRAVYDVSGLNMEKRYAHTIDVKTLIKEWEGYVMEHYNIDNLSSQALSLLAEQYNLSGMNTFQKAEAMKAIAKQSAGLPLSATEKAVLDLARVKNGH